MSISRRSCALLATAALLGGCASWFGSGSEGPKPAPLTPIDQAQRVRVLWSASVPAAGNFFFGPALAGDSVYAAGRDGTDRKSVV